VVQRTPLTRIAMKSSPQLTTEHDQVDECETDSDSDITDVDDFLTPTNWLFLDSIQQTWQDQGEH